MLVQEVNLQRSYSFRCNLVFCFGKSKTYMPMRPMRGTAYISAQPMRNKISKVIFELLKALFT